MKYQSGPFWTIFGLMMSPQGVKPSKVWNSGFKNEYFTSNFLFTIDFHLSNTIVTWNTIWPNFGLMTSPRKSKLQYFEKVISESNSLYQSSIKYWFRSFYYCRHTVNNFGPFLSNLEKMMSQKNKSRILKN